jgi:hypothetical protein
MDSGIIVIVIILKWGISMNRRALNDFAFIDQIYDTSCVTMINELLESLDNEKGFLYERNANVPKYYANANATVALNLCFCDLLDNTEKEIIANTIVNLKDNDYNNNVSVKNNVWDAAEGENVFSTALSCYALMCLDMDKYESIIDNSIKWILDAKQNTMLWSLYGNLYSESAIVSHYALLMLKRAYSMKYLPENKWKKLSADIFNRAIYLLNTEKDLAALISLLSMIKMIKSDYTVKDDLKKRINEIILYDEKWYISPLNTAYLTADNSTKSMYTYNPIYLISLIQLGWKYNDECILKMKQTLVEDIKRNWIKFPPYIWRTHSGEIQSFIVSMTLHALYYWVKKAKNSVFEKSEKIGERKIFISHASKDSGIVSHFVQYLNNIGLSSEKIFYTSEPNTGVQQNMEEIRKTLIESTDVIVYSTDNYYESVYCTNEAGYIWVSKSPIVFADKSINHTNMRGFIDQNYKIRHLFSEDDLNYLYDMLAPSYNLPKMSESDKGAFKKRLLSKIE